MATATDDPLQVSTQPTLNREARTKLYTGNLAPLTAQPLVKLPVGSIQPDGWLRTQLVGMRDGFVGHLDEISRFCRDDSAWLNPDLELGWEEAPYWLKGYVDLAYVLGDPKLIKTSQRWLNAIIESQQDDGYFGPRQNKKLHDAWPNMAILYPLQTYYEATSDNRVISLMSRYFKYRDNLAEDELFPSQWGVGDYNLRWWQHVRASDELECVYWLYNRTGDSSLLEYGERLYRLSANWNDNVASWHGVNICEGFRAPAIFSQQSGRESDIAGALASLKRVYDLYGQVPGGMFGADENCRKGHGDPRQAAETCSMAELMYSFEALLKITGNIEFADRCEDIAFNSLPASMSPDLKALHYLTAPNMIQLDRDSKSPGLENGGCMLAFSPHRYRCCQHNVAMSWPYFSEHLMLATADGGLAAVMYAPCRVKAKVRNGVEVEIEEKTDYPFKDRIDFTIHVADKVRFPFALRIPSWCETPSLKINGASLDRRPSAGKYAILDREWSDGDVVTLRLPMRITLKRWAANHDGVSVARGPLTYSLKIGERWERFDDPARQPFADAAQWPAWEVYATTPWNYGLVIDERPVESQFDVNVSDKPLPAQPFDVESAPVRIIARGQRIDNWTADRHHLIAQLQASPVRVPQLQPERLTLIPMGCARLRVSMFPTISEQSDAHEWKKLPRIPHQASHEHDDIAAISDGHEPQNSGDQNVPRFTWWPRRGTKEWVTFEFDSPVDVGEVNIYWFDDEGTGLCRIPESWNLYYSDDGDWHPVEVADADPVQKDRFNRLSFATVKTKALKLQVQLRDGFSSGILEWVPGKLGPS
ncbi:MAG: glycoside hydrolase family 127 protein [Phycisphaerales bacterium]|nr:glycoside hydrolase family 127 protein [Phycisphaerales bacterium]MCB9863171.1 glycoside hydrolase family 127 protein [Phycisphaerales bacterium]